MLSVVKRCDPRSRLYSLDGFFWLLDSAGAEFQKIREQHQWLFSFHAFHAGLIL